VLNFENERLKKVGCAVLLGAFGLKKYKIGTK